MSQIRKKKDKKQQQINKLGKKKNGKNKTFRKKVKVKGVNPFEKSKSKGQ